MTPATRDERAAEIAALRAVVRKAQRILIRYVVPGGITASQAMLELVGLFDGPKARAALEFKKVA